MDNNKSISVLLDNKNTLDSLKTWKPMSVPQIKITDEVVSPLSFFPCKSSPSDHSLGFSFFKSALPIPSGQYQQKSPFPPRLLPKRTFLRKGAIAPIKQRSDKDGTSSTTTMVITR